MPMCSTNEDDLLRQWKHQTLHPLWPLPSPHARPDDCNHLLWAAVGKAESPPFCYTFCTGALQLTVCHYISGEYTLRFRREFEALNVICECGQEECILRHIILNCPLSGDLAHPPIDI